MNIKPLGYEFNYEDSKYTITNVVANLYNIIGNGVRIHFECEWKNGSYFKIKSVTKNGRTYQAQRYFYNYIPLVREATFIIAEKDGLWDYKNNELHTYEGFEIGWIVRK